MRQVSIVTMMWAVAFFALGLAALHNASEVWAGVMLMLTLGVLGTAVIAVACRRGRERIWWLGFALFGIVYATLTFLPWFSPIGDGLATSHFLAYLNAQAIPTWDRDPLEVQVRAARTRIQGISQADINFGAIVHHFDTLQRALSLRNAKRQAQGGGPVGPALSPIAGPIQRLLPGIEDPWSFTRIGHCLFALLAGLVGAGIGSRLYREPPQNPSE